MSASSPAWRPPPSTASGCAPSPKATPSTSPAVVGEPADPLDGWLLPTLVPLTHDASIVMLESADGTDRALADEAAILLA